MNRCYASIEIGGKIEKSLLKEFATILNKEYLCLKEEEVPVENYTAETLKEIMLNSPEGVLEMYSIKSKDGFDALEQWLVDHKISFKRYSEGTGETDRENIYYNGKSDKIFNFPCTVEGEDLIYRKDIKKILENLNSEKDIKRTKRLLKKVLGNILEEVPRLVIK